MIVRSILVIFLQFFLKKNCQFNYVLNYCCKSIVKSIIFSIITWSVLVEPGFESSLDPSVDSEGEGPSRVWTQAYNWLIRWSVSDPCPCLVCTALYCNSQLCIALYFMALHNTVILHITILQCTTLGWLTLFRTKLQYIALHWTVWTSQHCTELRRITEIWLACFVPTSGWLQCRDLHQADRKTSSLLTLLFAEEVYICDVNF